jgi:protein subunit release factor A
MMEIRAGTGGDEAKYFAGDLPYVHQILKKRMENLGCRYE